MRRHLRGTVRLKHLSQSGYWPSGNPRFYFRPPPKGTKTTRMPDAPADSAEFLSAYVAASGEAPKQKPKTFVAGTIGAAVTAYLGSSSFLGLAASSRAVWRARAENIRERYGDAMVEELSAKNIKLDLSTYEGHGANNRLKVWRSLCQFWDERGMIEVNVAKQVAPRKTIKTDGHTPWTRDDFKAFRAFWPIGSKERLAFELMYRTCAAMGDACLLTRADVKDGWLTYSRQKSKSVAIAPFYVDGPKWFEATDDLQACLNVEPMHMTFLTTQIGKSRSQKGASSWFSKAATAAGLDRDRTAHGIRKGRAAIFKENGASVEQRMAVLGHETEKEAARYSKSADLRRTIEGTEKFQLLEKVPTTKNNPLIIKGKNHV